LRLGDTDLVVEIEKDFCAGPAGVCYGDEVKFGGEFVLDVAIFMHYHCICIYIYIYIYAHIFYLGAALSFVVKCITCAHILYILYVHKSI